MKVETLRELGQPASGYVPSRARTLLMAALAACVAILVVHHETVISMVRVWGNAVSYGHCFLVLPVALWLGWERRAEVPWGHARPYVPAIAVSVIAGVAWLLGDLTSVASVQQFALVVMLQATFVAVMGIPVSRALVYPILFLLLAVPTGEFLTPQLIDWTADFTVRALQFSGIPVYREGNDFLIPSGRWSVVEACSGVRYLFASVMGGTAFAYLQYRSTVKRLGFIAISIVVPILANWVRAYLIVLTGHLTSNEYAVGADHLIYGTVFFGVIILTLFGIGSRFRDRNSPPMRIVNPPVVVPRFGVAVAVAGLAFAVASMWVPLGAATQARVNDGKASLEPFAAPDGWRVVEEVSRPWRATFEGAASASTRVFERDGRQVHVAIGYFLRQEPGRELVTNAHDFLRGSEDWRPMRRAQQSIESSVGAIPVKETVLQGASERIALAATYWVDGRFVASEYTTKMLTAIEALRTGRDDAAMVVLYAYQTGDDQPHDAVRQFAAAAFPGIKASLENARAR